ALKAGPPNCVLCCILSGLLEINYAFQEALNSAGEKLVVVDFSATWCGPCKMIKPFFHSLSEKYSNVVFLEVDVDDCQDVASECEVKCMPTFQFFKKGQKAHSVVISDIQNRDAMLHLMAIQYSLNR
ncbi:hypothetical protein DBR06_SOUSAS310103, partial [Sousa chinensis]